MSDDKKIIFSMSGVTKTFQSANTPVLKNIYLSFFYGAKIGILGLNGSGKSTILKLICGILTPTKGKIKVKGKKLNKSVFFVVYVMRHRHVYRGQYHEDEGLQRDDQYMKDRPAET